LERKPPLGLDRQRHQGKRQIMATMIVTATMIARRSPDVYPTSFELRELAVVLSTVTVGADFTGLELGPRAR
jgi:hypothetical protein